MFNPSNESFNPRQTRWLTTARAFIPGVIALITTFCFFICCILLFPVTVFLPESAPLVPPRSIPWDFLGNLTSLATFALVVGGLVFAFVDYVRNAVQRNREESESSFNMYKFMYDQWQLSDVMPGSGKPSCIREFPFLHDLL